MPEILSEKTVLLLAVDLGLFIIFIWFFISLLMLREFRKFSGNLAEQMVAARDSDTLELCHQAVDNALSYTSVHSNTLNELISIQQALETQVTKLEQANIHNSSPEDKIAMKELNQKLTLSHRLIKRLKTDLDRSIKGLQKTKKKLTNQNETVDTLKNENEQMHKDIAQLEEEYLRISRSAEAQNLISGGAEDSELERELEATKHTLKETLTKLQHLEKEKNFIESRYIQVLEELENNKTGNHTPPAS